MANRKNAILKIRKDEKARQRNKSDRTELRSLSKEFLDLCKTKKQDEAKVFLTKVYATFDKAVKKGVVKENSANRQKSRLSKQLNLIQ